MTFLLYLCKVFLCSGILLGYYWFFLRNKRFHHYNRFYLQATLLLSVLLPFIKIRLWYQPQNAVNQVMYQTIDVLTVNYGESDLPIAGNTPVNPVFTVQNLLYLVYAVGAIVLLWLLAKSLWYIRRLSKQYPYEVISRLKFYSTSEPGTPFSFFRSVFWNARLPFNSKEGQQIFRHELFHIQQKHSLDILLAEVITAFFWYNPFFHLLKKELKAIHEFLADQYAASGSDRYAYAELLVLQTMKAKNISVTHCFFQNHIKRRIAMITHPNLSKNSYWRRIMPLPISVLLFCSIALYAQQPGIVQANTDGKNKPITVVIDAGHGGLDNGAASSDGKILEKDLALQISQKIQQLAPAYNINVIMTRTGDVLPGNAAAIREGLLARTAITEQAKADAFIAIHISASPDNNTRNGAEVYIPSGNEKWKAASKALGNAVSQSVGPLYSTNAALLQRKERKIWVLEQAPCPAILVECGYMTNDKDLAYINNSNNQETVAKKILEGIVSYKNQQAVTTIPDNDKSNQPQAQYVQHVSPAAQAPVQPSVTQKTEDSIVLMKVTRHFCRHTRYPQKAFDHHMEGTVYYSLQVSEDGQISSFQTYSQLPATAAKIHDLVVVGYAPSFKPAITDKLSNKEESKIFQEAVERAFEKKPDLTGSVIKEAGSYYFKVNFRLEKPGPPTTVTIGMQLNMDTIRPRTYFKNTLK